jgi:hypothetical protein
MQGWWLGVACAFCKRGRSACVIFAYTQAAERMPLQKPRHGKPMRGKLRQGEKEPLLLRGAEVGEMNGSGMK